MSVPWWIPYQQKYKEGIRLGTESKPGRMFSKPTEFRMSFIVAHSSIKVEEIVGTKTTFNQKKYFIFLKSLIHKLKSDSEVRNKKLFFCDYRQLNIP